jgi:hypothetical protein
MSVISIVHYCGMLKTSPCIAFSVWTLTTSLFHTNSITTAANGWAESPSDRILLTIFLSHSHHSIYFRILSILRFGLYANACRIHVGDSPLRHTGKGVCAHGMLCYNPIVLVPSLLANDFKRIWLCHYQWQPTS